MFSHFLVSADSDVLTVVQTLNFDLVEIQRGGHADVKGTLRDGVSSVAHSDGHVPLKQTPVNSVYHSAPSLIILLIRVLSDLLDGGVADGVRVVVVVDDLEVSDSFTFSCSGEMNLRLSFTGSLCVDGEVGRFTHFNSCRVLKTN